MDWYLPNLYSFLKDLEITTVVNNLSRYVIDLNREITNNINTSSYADNYIYTKTTFNNPVYKTNLENEEIRDRITKYYAPYHQALEKLDFVVGLNNPYSGGYITRKYANNKVETLQLELGLGYKKYIDDRTFGNEKSNFIGNLIRT